MPAGRPSREIQRRSTSAARRDRLALVLVGDLGERDRALPGRQRLEDRQQRRQPGLVGREQAPRRPPGRAPSACAGPRSRRVADRRAPRPRRRAPDVAVEVEVDVDRRPPPGRSRRTVKLRQCCSGPAAGKRQPSCGSTSSSPSGAQPSVRISPGCSMPGSAKAGACSVKRVMPGVSSRIAATVAMPVWRGNGRRHRRAGTISGQPGLRVGDDARAQAEHALHERGVDDLRRVALGHDRALAHRDQVVGVAARVVEVVEHGDDGVAVVLVQVRAQVEHLELVRDVEERRRLVEQQQRRLLGEHHRQPDALALAAGELVDRAPGEVVDRGAAHRERDRLLVLARPLAQDPLVRIAPARDEVGDGDGVGRDRALGQQAEPPRDLLRAGSCRSPGRRG